MATQQQQTTIPTYGARSMYDTKSPWERMLTQMLMAQRLGSRGMAGFALGQILSGLLQQWKANYDARGVKRREWESLTPEERTARLAEIEAKDPLRAAEERKFVTDRWGEGAFAPAQTPAQAPAQPQIAPAPTTAQPLLQPQATTNPIRAALNAEMPNTNWQQQQPQLLGSDADWQRTLEELARRRTQLGGVQYAF